MLVAFPRLVGVNWNLLSTFPPFFLPQHTIKKCNRILPTYSGFDLENELCFALRWVALSIQQMLLISQGGKFSCRIPPLYLPQLLKVICPMCPAFMEGGDTGRDFQDHCCLPLFGDHPKAADTPQLQVLNSILQRSIYMNLLKNIGFSGSGHHIWTQLVCIELVEHIQKCLVLFTFGQSFWFC